MLAKLMEKTEESKIFLDSDPEVFRFILNFFRRGETMALPENRDLLTEIRVEADYYGLPTIFIKKLDEKLIAIKPKDPFNGFMLEVDLPRICPDDQISRGNYYVTDRYRFSFIPKK